MGETTTADRTDEAGDVVPLPLTRPSVDTLPTPSQKYLPGYSPYFPQGKYDYDWHRILTPPPSNDARNQELPDSLQPGYQPQMPVQLAQGGVQTGGPTVGPSQLPPELGGTVVPPGSFQPGRPPGQQVAQNYSVIGSGPGTWWQQQHPQNQPPASLQPAGPGFRYTPPQNSEQPPVRSMPALWNGNQVGPSGQTKQQFLLGRMMHESQGDPTALNYVARANPRAWDAGFTASGLLQDTSTTWANGVKWALADPERYPMSDDPRKYPVAGYAPWDVQWQVNSAIYDHAGETPWRERNGPAGQSFKARLDGGFYDQMSSQTQHYAPAQPRSFAEWGRAPVGMGGSQPGQMPRPNDFGRIMGSIAPLLVGIASLAARMPLSTAITAYGAMARAQQNGQQLEYERNRTRFQDQLKEHNAQQALESQEAGDAFSEYGNNNPQGLQQQLASIALKYNDPIMFRMAEQGDLNGIHELQAKRDTYGQDLSKLEKAHQEQQDRQAQDAAVSAMDRKYQQEHPDATPDDLAIAHNEHIGEAARAGTKDPKAAGSTVEAPVYDVVDKDGNPTGKQVRAGKNGGFVDADTGQPAQIDRSKGERVEQTPRERQPKSEGPKSSDYKDYEWEDADDGKMHHGSAAIVPGKGLVDPSGNPINAKPGTINAVGTRGADRTLSEPKAYDVVGPDDRVRRTVMLRDRRDQPGFEDAETGQPFQHASDERLVPHSARAAGGTAPRFGTTDDLMQRWHEQFVKDNNREPSTEEIANQRKEFTQEAKPPPVSARQVSQRLGIAIGEAAGGVAALTQLSANATLGPWGGAQAALTTNSFENFKKSLTNRVTPTEARMMNSIAKVIARPLASLEAAGVATGLVGVTQSLQTEFPQSGDDGYTVLTKLANIRNIVDAAADMLARDKNLDPEIKKLIAENREKVDAAIPYTLDNVVAAEVNPTRENMRGLAERLLHRGGAASGGRSGGLPDGVTVEVK